MPGGIRVNLASHVILSPEACLEVWPVLLSPGLSLQDRRPVRENVADEKLFGLRRREFASPYLATSMWFIRFMASGRDALDRRAVEPNWCRPGSWELLGRHSGSSSVNSRSWRSRNPGQRPHFHLARLLLIDPWNGSRHEVSLLVLSVKVLDQPSEKGSLLEDSGVFRSIRLAVGPH